MGNLYKESWENILNSEKFAWFENAFDDDSTDILWNNAIKIGRMLQSVEVNCMGGGKTLEDKEENIIKDLLFSKNICIFGLGKLFFDIYNNIPWKNVLLSDREGFCSDNSISRRRFVRKIW